jgi:hypothetical protein
LSIRSNRYYAERPSSTMKTLVLEKPFGSSGPLVGDKKFRTPANETQLISLYGADLNGLNFFPVISRIYKRQLNDVIPAKSAIVDSRLLEPGP